MMVPEDKTPGNFKSVWLKYDINSSDKHQLFIKEHSVKRQQPEHPKGRTLFVLNIPPYATKDSLKNIFARHCGGVTSVSLHPALGGSQNGFKTAYIVFAKEFSLEKALALPRDFTVVLETEETPQNPLGLLKWCREYNEETNVDETTVKEEIAKYMAAYDKRIEERLAAGSTQEDADGWVTVSSKKKRGQFAPSRKESTIDKVQHKEQEKSKKKQLLNFYTFQIRESKKQHLAELRKKFEMDKQKLQQLKTKRTFKPFG
ncbi:ribosomal RNA-processing protein 7 homolog A [Diachasma alloeum]|uniref:ribosomal RNA-processing protein 7 homolog A n=1 Tax=Diachasma alloeum TaxID=454923 RepID=UPI00073826AB|nr:ribosomal RNA-processing protein 7 homolog A [Diachasma alloeum]